MISQFEIFLKSLITFIVLVKVFINHSVYMSYSSFQCGTKCYFICFFLFCLCLWLNAGVSQSMDCNLRSSGQCGDVEHKIRELGQTVLGSAVLSPGLLPCKLLERRITNPEECPDLWKGERPAYKTFLKWLDISYCHERVAWFLVWSRWSLR